jgi:quercetin dioxygenase-like cupin family protein
MNQIVKSSSVNHPRLPGVSIYNLEGGSLVQGKRQNVVVNVLPNNVIPLHKHESSAIMFVVSGSAKLLSEDKMNGTYVTVGDRIHWDAFSSHGFEAGSDGLLFISTNDGIVDQKDFKHWDIIFCEEKIK